MDGYFGRHTHKQTILHSKSKDKSSLVILVYLPVPCQCNDRDSIVMSSMSHPMISTPQLPTCRGTTIHYRL